MAAIAGKWVRGDAKGGTDGGNCHGWGRCTFDETTGYNRNPYSRNALAAAQIVSTLVHRHRNGNCPFYVGAL